MVVQYRLLPPKIRLEKHILRPFNVFSIEIWLLLKLAILRSLVKQLERIPLHNQLLAFCL